MKPRTAVLASLMVLGAFVLGSVVSGINPASALAPAGKLRVDHRSVDNDPRNTTSTSFVDIPGMSLTVKVPSGSIGDVMISFSGVMNSPDVLNVRANVGGIIADPGSTQMFANTAGSATSQAANFRTVVGAGSRTLKMQWSGGGGQQFISERTLLVWVNVRPSA